MPKQTFETKNSHKPLSERAMLAAKIISATGVAALAGVAFNNSRDYGYHSDRNPSPPTYMDSHSGINPADIVHNDNNK